ncbi:fimbrial biogenesis chaperone [Edwardsiella tarda]|uniref:fimbrial biogenesis chaperone n=1 Tax=Edwardsiella tarda TaxID=636 RepID=UPI003081E8A9|nr:fimbrial chaperone [Edwardsiella tarda]
MSVIRCFTTLAVLWALLSSAHASVQINGTRVIYNADARDVSVQLTNSGKYPVLVQSWLDDGDPDTLPEKASAPFTLTPPLARLREGGGQTLRLAFIATQTPPADRESVWWLNVLEIPPESDKGGNELQLQLAFRSRIKLFYRPAGLNAEQANKAVRQLRWRSAGNTLTLHNPTPYFVSLTRVSISGGPKSLTLEADMVSPYGEFSLDLPAGRTLNGQEKVVVGYVNDYGAFNSQPIQHQ